ncbi:hypothetical protein BH09ACT1_BH09ACT1_08000 [soil metagenome]
MSGQREGVRVGCDIVPVDSIEWSIDAFGDAYLERIFSPLERAQSGSSADRIAARFAGKEAVMKLLRPTATDAVPYRDIEIATLPSGAPHVRLHGAARIIASQFHLDEFTVSLSHDAGIAFATASCTTRKDIPMTSTVIRDVLARYGKLTTPVAELADTADLHAAGLASHATINVMLAIEDELGIEFPDELMTRTSFSSIEALTGVVDSLKLVTS